MYDNQNNFQQQGNFQQQQPQQQYQQQYQQPQNQFNGGYQQNNVGGMFVDNNADVDSGSGELPKGRYPVRIVAAEYVENERKTGFILKLEHDILDGNYKGRKIFDNYNLQHSNEQTQRIAQSQYAKLCESAFGKGAARPTNPQLLIGAVYVIEWGKKRPKKRDNDYHTEEQEEQRAEVLDRLPVSVMAPAQQQQQAPMNYGHQQQQQQYQQPQNQFNGGQQQMNNGGNFQQQGNFQQPQNHQQPQNQFNGNQQNNFQQQEVNQQNQFNGGNFPGNQQQQQQGNFQQQGAGNEAQAGNGSGSFQGQGSQEMQNANQFTGNVNDGGKPFGNGFPGAM